MLTVAAHRVRSTPKLQAQLAGLGLPILLVATLGRATLPNLLTYLAVGRPAPASPVAPTSVALTVSSIFSLMSVIALAFLVLGRSSSHARSLVTAWLVYAILAATSAYFGDHIAATTAVVSLLALLAVGQAQSDLDVLTRLASRLLVAVMCLCLLLVVLRPDIAKYGDGESTWLSRDARLAGPFSTANEAANLASVTVVLLLSRWRRCSEKQILGLGISLAVLLLTQSYTSWLACAVGSAVVLSAPRPGLTRHISVSPLVALAAGIFFIVRFITRAERTADLSTLNGRQRVWTYVLQHWGDAPLLGTGSGIWRRLIFEQQVPAWAVHAHNQGLNTLYVGGLVGVLALSVAVLVSCRVAVQQWRLGIAVAAGLLALELVRSYAEVPFELLGGGTNLFVLILMVALLRGVHGRGVIHDRTDA